MNVVGITGAAGSGKDTIAGHLTARYAYMRIAMADPLKRALNVMFNFKMEQWDDRVWKETDIPWLGASPRKLAQTIGTEWGRDLINPDLWVLLAERSTRSLLALGHMVVIPDIRFENEVRMIQRLGGEIWKVTRADTGPVNPHVSELGLPDRVVRRFIPNSGTISELLERVDIELRLIGPQGPRST